MNWFWDNIHLKREERLGMFAFICILLILLMLKWYMVVLYTPAIEIYDRESIEHIEYTIISPSQTELRPLVSSTKTNLKKNEEYKQKQKKQPAKDVINEVKTKRLLFEFDPNITSIDSLKLLGITPYAANNIFKYRSNGGYFKKAEDLYKIYGIDSLLLKEITPLIRISQGKQHFKPKGVYGTLNKSTTPSIALHSIDINQADTTQFKQLRGIGSVYANRIVKFRNSLGGYFTVDQIKDVWGISDSLFTAIKPYLTVDTSLIEKRNINLLDRELLVRHPYMDWKKAKVILSYKRMHGDYKSIDDFEKLHGIDKEFIDTLRYYFVVQ